MNENIIKEESISFPSGVNIFEQGDNVNNLYFIKEGTVEVYLVEGTNKIVLGNITKGELIGILNLLGADSSKVNVRSLSKMILGVYNKSDILNYIVNLPMIIKEIFFQLISKIKGLNSKYLNVLQDLHRFQNKGVTSFFIALQIASASQLIAKLVLKKVDGEDKILFDEFVNHLEICFCKSKEEILKILYIFIEHNFLFVKQDSVKKFKYILPESFSRLNYFNIFIKELNEGRHKAILKHKLSPKDIRVLMSFIKFAKLMGLDLKQEIRLKYEDLERSLSKVTGINFDPKVVDVGQKLNLINILEDAGAKYLVISPLILSKILSALEIRRKLMELDLTRDHSNDETSMLKDSEVLII